MEKEKFENMKYQKTQALVSSLMYAYPSMLGGGIPVSDKAKVAVRDLIKELNDLLTDWTDTAYSLPLD